MFDFSFGELVLIALVALLVVGPKDLPVVVRAVGRWMGQFRGIADEFRQGFRSVMNEAALDETGKELRENMQFIKDEHGNLQRVYDLSDFMDERERAKVTIQPAAPPPNE